MESLVRLKNINLSYDNVKALKNVNLTLNKSEVHGMVGEHGAGKTSLSLILSGLIRPDSGVIIWEDRQYKTLPFDHAKKLGISIVTQQSSLFPLMSVADNFFIKNKEIRKNWFISKRKNKHKTRKYLERFDIDIDPAMPVKNLSSPDRYLLDILINIFHQPMLLILDEALENITSAALNRILPILEKLKKDGTTILFITHRVDNIFEFADRVTILKNGEILLTDFITSIDKFNLIKLAYTQISREGDVSDANKEFYQLLKYNEAILDNLPVNMIVVNKTNNIKLINNNAKKYFNVEDSFYFNMPVEAIFSPHDRKFGELICEALEKNSKETFLDVPIRINNVIAKNNVITYPIHDGSFRIGSVIITNDVTEQDRLREQIILSEKLASVGLLAAGVAHEINNPLEIIYSYLDYIKLNLQNKKLDTAIDDLTEEINSIAQIVNNLVTFSDNHPNREENFNINEVILGILNLVKFSAEKNHIKISFKSRFDLLKIKANKTEIKQVILNLIKNSFEAMPGGGKLHIETDQIHEHDQGKSYARLIFQDNGCGISEDQIEDIFLPFYSTKDRKKENLGLGLSVTYGIIKKYYGDIYVRNLENEGTEFIVILPVSDHKIDGNV